MNIQGKSVLSRLKRQGKAPTDQQQLEAITIPRVKAREEMLLPESNESCDIERKVTCLQELRALGRETDTNKL